MPYSRLLTLVGILLSLNLAACGRNAVSSSKSYRHRVPVIIAHGGWGSCGVSQGLDTSFSPTSMKMYQHFGALRHQLAQLYGEEPRYFIGCYTELKASEGDKSHYFSTLNPTEYRRASPAETTQVVIAMTKGIDADVYIIGHSFGGWLAMWLADQLPASVHISLLATIDPISQVNCSSWHFVASYLNGGYPGCEEAPSDFSQAQLQGIRARLTEWLNVYQTRYHFLHSGPIAEASINLPINLPYDDHWAHALLESDENVWTRITADIDRLASHQLAKFATSH